MRRNIPELKARREELKRAWIEIGDRLDELARQIKVATEQQRQRRQKRKAEQGRAQGEGE